MLIFRPLDWLLCLVFAVIAIVLIIPVAIIIGLWVIALWFGNAYYQAELLDCRQARESSCSRIV